MSIIYVIRHGQASFASDNYDRLSDLGREQAAITGRWLGKQGIRFDATYCGTMERQIDTAALVLDGMSIDDSLELIRDAGFNEYDSDGVVRSLLPELLKERPDLEPLAEKMFTDRRSFQIIFERIMLRWVSGERDRAGCIPFARFQSNVSSAMGRLMKNTGRGKTVALFTSGGPIAMIVQMALHLADDIGISVNWQVFNASVSTFFYNDRKITMSTFNSPGHLQAEDRPEIITYR